MLYRDVPFDGANMFQLLKLQKREIIDWKNDIIADGSKISKESKDFITRCLRFHEKDRISWMDIYLHPLFNDCFGYK